MLYTFNDQTISTTTQPPDGGQVTSHIGPPTNITLLQVIELPYIDWIEQNKSNPLTIGFFSLPYVLFLDTL